MFGTVPGAAPYRVPRVPPRSAWAVPSHRYQPAGANGSYQSAMVPATIADAGAPEMVTVATPLPAATATPSPTKLILSASARVTAPSSRTSTFNADTASGSRSVSAIEPSAICADPMLPDNFAGVT